ncbi:MAG TPA: DUF4926 domain-containing protein [Tepidisphaeraceae bacterium]|nr:DUF4926 domain-containing protein [Tepidisphaeraceae bacterium]
MRSPAIDEMVKLTQDIPELSLSRGMCGVVRSTWCAPWVAYEVEFHIDGNTYETRALLMAEQVEVEEQLETDELVSQQ